MSLFWGDFPFWKVCVGWSAGLGRGEAMVGASRAGVDPRTARVAWGVQLLVGGGHGVIRRFISNLRKDTSNELLEIFFNYLN